MSSQSSHTVNQYWNFKWPVFFCACANNFPVTSVNLCRARAAMISQRSQRQHQLGEVRALSMQRRLQSSTVRRLFSSLFGWRSSPRMRSLRSHYVRMCHRNSISGRFHPIAMWIDMRPRECLRASCICGGIWVRRGFCDSTRWQQQEHLCHRCCGCVWVYVLRGDWNTGISKTATANALCTKKYVHDILKYN